MNKLKTSIIMYLQKRSYFLKWASYVFNTIAFVALVSWLFKCSLTIHGYDVDYEALFTILTMIAVVIGQLYGWLLSEAEYSPAHALALGYVNNFLEPAITQLIENGENFPCIYVYKPKAIPELYQTSIDRMKGQIRNNFDLNEIQLNLKHGRARDILTIQKSKTKKIYFDFPNTITSLVAYIDYKAGSAENESSDKKKQDLTQKLIDKFFEEVDSLASKKNLTQYICYCDDSLNFNF